MAEHELKEGKIFYCLKGRGAIEQFKIEVCLCRVINDKTESLTHYLLTDKLGKILRASTTHTIRDGRTEYYSNGQIKIFGSLRELHKHKYESYRNQEISSESGMNSNYTSYINSKEMYEKYHKLAEEEVKLMKQVD